MTHQGARSDQQTRRVASINRVLSFRLVAVFLVIAMVIGWSIYRDSHVAALSKQQQIELSQLLLDTKTELKAHLQWHELASRIHVLITEFQLEFELLTLDPDRNNRRIAEISDDLHDSFENLKTLGKYPPIARLSDSLYENLWIVIDISEELLDTKSANARLQLHRDSQYPLVSVIETIHQIDEQLASDTMKMSVNIEKTVELSRLRLEEQAELTARTHEIIQFLLIAAAVVAVAIMRGFFITLRRRISLLEDYANLIGEKQILSPPFSSKDPLGRLGIQLGLVARKIRRSFSEAQEARSQAEELAFFDVLTGLENRRHFYQNLEHEIATVKRYGDNCSLLILDVDNFKQINDALGHEAGDKLLIHIAHILQNSVRHDDHIARFGGDEFALLVRHTRESSFKLANRILEQVYEPIELEGQQVRCSVSIGIAIVGADGDSVTELMKSADLALYLAKERGRNNCQYFSPELQEKAQEKLRLFNEIRAGINRSEFFLVYQPKFDSKTMELVGVEALARWNHPKRGIVGPDSFIPAAEESGLIVDLGEFVLRQACQAASEYSSSGRKIPVAVNLSARQFMNTDLVNSIIAIRDEYDIQPWQLELEVTESLLISDIELSILRLAKLKEAAIAIAIDDFGTGFSSMNYLKRLPIHVLKIDRSFVSGLPKSSEDASIVKAVTNLAHDLGLKLVAEGVETKAQLSFLQGIGCDIIQGYLLSTPVTFDEAVSSQHKEAMIGRK